MEVKKIFIFIRNILQIVEIWKGCQNTFNSSEKPGDKINRLCQTSGNMERMSKTIYNHI